MLLFQAWYGCKYMVFYGCSHYGCCKYMVYYVAVPGMVVSAVADAQRSLAACVARRSAHPC